MNGEKNKKLLPVSPVGVVSGDKVLSDGIGGSANTDL